MPRSLEPRRGARLSSTRFPSKSNGRHALDPDLSHTTHNSSMTDLGPPSLAVLALRCANRGSPWLIPAAVLALQGLEEDSVMTEIETAQDIDNMTAKLDRIQKLLAKRRLAFDVFMQDLVKPVVDK